MKILLVCTGNICRSPMAEGLLNHMLQGEGLQNKHQVDSAGTHAIANQPPDANACSVMAMHGIDISLLRSRPLVIEDFETCDQILLADQFNRDYIRSKFRIEQHAGLDMLLHYHPQFPDADVPDPYGGGENHFVDVYRLISQACIGLVEELQSGS